MKKVLILGGGFAGIQKKYPFEVIIDTVEEIHANQRKVVCANQTLSYDFLIVAFGAGKMKHKGLENTLSICGKPEVAVSIGNGLDELIQKGSGKIGRAHV